MLLCRLSGAQGAAVMSFPPLLNKYRALAILRSQVVADLRGRARKQRIWKQIFRLP